MSKFINDELPVLQISRADALKVIQKVSSLYPAKINCLDKRAGPDNFMCRDLAPISRQVRDDFETIEWGENLEFAGCALDFVGLALKQSSKYLMVVKPSELDFKMILSNLEAREDIAVLD
ncbi:hypothetical protein GRI69_13250 [Erythrobacter vulgaris]|uniref:Uncharacterized protein n=1 Tax=Qipengyuania vulgaris TaxID=291985 RepID=A0A844XU03_9SPHN|nr:hypothetical protein [Qipengyuania vulgaris]MXO49220.1 hypothetical protein [Qipengyuania vulgaris]